MKYLLSKLDHWKEKYTNLQEKVVLSLQLSLFFFFFFEVQYEHWTHDHKVVGSSPTCTLHHESLIQNFLFHLVSPNLSEKMAAMQYILEGHGNTFFAWEE